MFRQKVGCLSFFRESHCFPRKTAENPETPDFIGSFKSNERKLRPVKISAQSDRNCGFLGFLGSAPKVASNKKWPKIVRSF